LKLNHADYYDCEISEKNLASYPEDGPPVVLDYYLSSSNKNPESTSVNDMDEEEGTSEGPCSFVVHKDYSCAYDALFTVLFEI